jgi:hypothetical protein
MILPRSHTWMHLLPPDARYECADAPDWLRAPLDVQSSSAGEGPRVRVISSSHAPRAVAPHGSLDNCEALVTIGPGPSESTLKEAGLGYVRRFAVLPSLQDARWFVPLDNPAVAAAAFCLYQPFKTSAKLKVLAAKTAIRARLPIWYRDTIQIARRTEPALEARLGQLFPWHSIRLALSSGMPGPDFRRKPSIAILSEEGAKLAFAKLAGSPIARALLEHEARVLPALAPLGIAPRLLMAESIQGTYVLVQSPLPGKPAGTSLTAPHRAFLQRLSNGAIQSAASAGLLDALRRQARALPAPPMDLLAALDAIMPTLREMNVPKTITHTDVVPWNLRLCGGQIAAFDWDTAELDGLPQFDEIHHELMVGYCLHNWPVGRAETYLAAHAQAAPMGLRPPQVRALQTVYLIHSTVRMLMKGHADNHEMVQWYRDVLARVRRLDHPPAETPRNLATQPRVPEPCPT